MVSLWSFPGWRKEFYRLRPRRRAPRVRRFASYIVINDHVRPISLNDDDQYVELVHIATNAVDLGLGICVRHPLCFSANTIVQSDGYLVVVRMSRGC